MSMTSGLPYVQTLDKIFYRGSVTLVPYGLVV